MYGKIIGDTLPETDIASERWWFFKTSFAFGKAYFQGISLVLGRVYLLLDFFQESKFPPKSSRVPGRFFFDLECFSSMNSGKQS